MKNIKLYNEDNIEVMKRLPDESIDVICIDPPYLYLKGQKLERPFDEQLFFSECKRLLTKKGFIVMFGRGVSFYRWNCILADLGFEFKEEIVWNKIRHSSPLTSIARTHELLVIFSKTKSKINRVRVNYGEMKMYNLQSIKEDLKRLSSFVKGNKTIDETMMYLEKPLKNKTFQKDTICVSAGKERIKVECSLLKQIFLGMREKSILTIDKEHYTAIHPTQKPVRLLERLLALVIPKDKEAKDIVVADFFGGSMSCMEAVHNMGMQGIACEIDEEYYLAGKERIENLTNDSNSRENIPNCRA